MIYRLSNYPQYEIMIYLLQINFASIYSCVSVSSGDLECITKLYKFNLNTEKIELMWVTTDSMWQYNHDKTLNNMGIVDLW